MWRARRPFGATLEDVEKVLTGFVAEACDSWLNKKSVRDQTSVGSDTE